MEIERYIPLAIIIILAVIPCSKILRRIGVSRWMLLLMIFPPIGLMVFVWFVAYCHWPGHGEKQA